MGKKIFSLTLCLFISIGIAFAQNITVSGVVTDASNGEPVPFAAIQLQGTMTGGSTDADGNYSLSVPSNGVLVFSSVGYLTIEVSVNGRSEINVTLTPDTQMLDETIVVAYGTSTRRSFTGSAAEIDSKIIEKKITTNVTNALAGTTPGVQVISSSGDPASNAGAIRIRGIGSMSASNSPLIVLDGVPYNGTISDINPNDVANISVLKDASASAIYGHRGANGVVLITTKRGQRGEAQVRLDAKWGSNSRLIPQYDVITDPAQYYETYYKLLYNQWYYSGHGVADSYAQADKSILDVNNGGLGYQVFTVPEGQRFIGTNFRVNPNATLGYSDGTYTYLPDDWYKEAFHNGFRQEYNMSISGASDRFNYYASGAYLNDGGMVENSGYQRYIGRINAEYQAKPWMKFLTNMSFSHSQSNSPSYSPGTFGSSDNIFYLANTMGPIYPLYVRDAEGNIMQESGRTIYDANQTNFKRPGAVGNAIRDNVYNKDLTYADVLTGKWGAVLTPVKGLTLTANIGLTSDNTRRNYLGSVYGSSAGTDGYAYASHGRLFTVNTQYLAQYQTDFGGTQHSVDILAGYEQYKLKSQSISGENDHLFDPNIGELNNADGHKSENAYSSTNSYMTEGFLSRIQYDYAGKYFVSASYRRDASSRFAKGHRWGDFGSLGAAWLMSEEPFLNSIDQIDMLKLKVSYGVQGNDNLGSYYPYSDQYTHSYNEETGQYSITLSYKGNEDLTWETSKSFNVGVDFGFFNGLLNGTFEVFARKTEDLLYSKDVPLSSGNPTGRVPINVGSIMNKGFELSLDGNILNTQKVNWTWNLNISHYKNEILELDSSVSEKGIRGSNYIYKIGGSLYEAYMYRYAGVDKETGQGLYYYKEKDEDGNETGNDLTTTVFTNAERYEIGTVLPKLYGGFGTTLNAYGFDLSAQFQFQLGGRYYDGSYQALMHTQKNAGQAMHKDMLKSWTPENPDSNFPRLDGDTQVAQSAVDRFLISSNYLSVNNVTLGYTFPTDLVKKIKISSLRLYVAAENLAVFTKRKGIDPRYSFGLGSYTSGSGLNTGGYSAMRNITGGVTISF
jgi:TonB-linked SusC/RagA family outer membrane protein